MHREWFRQLNKALQREKTAMEIKILQDIQEDVDFVDKFLKSELSFYNSDIFE